MQKPKKLAALTLALMLAASLTVSAATTETVSGRNSKTIDVKAKYTGGTTTATVYSVDVTWGEMEFTYSVSGTREWNPATHEYTDNASAGWTESGNEVTVVNHSNADVTVDFAYAPAAGYDDLVGSFTVSTATLRAGVEGNAAAADKVSTLLTLSGDLASTAAAFTKVGSVTVSLH